MLHTGLEESSYSLEVKDLPVFPEFVPCIPPSYS